LKYKDAGKKLDMAIPEMSKEKYYPRFSIDEKETDKLEIDDMIPLRGRVCGVHKSDSGNSIEVEVTEIGVPDVKKKSKESSNEADRDLERMTER
jgi:hypothetical protein